MATRSARDLLTTEGPRIRRAILLGLVALVPLIFLRTLADPINVPKLGLLIIGVSIVIALRIAELLQDRDLSGLKLLMVPAGAVALPLSLSWVFSPYRSWALWGSYPRLLGLLPYLFVILFGMLLAEAFRGRAFQVAWALVAAGGLSGAYALVQFAGLDPFTWSVKGADATGIVVSTLGNSNFAGGFFAIVLPVGVALFLVDRNHRWWSGGFAAAAAGGWVVAGSEAAWAAGLAGLSVMAGIGLARSQKLRIAGLLAAVGLAAVVVAAVIASMGGYGESTIPLTIQRRGDWWQAAVSMGEASPILGRGPNAFAIEHPRYRTIEDVRQSGLDITDDPHSVIMSFFSAGGVLGLSGYLLAAGWGLRRVFTTPTGDLVASAFAGAFVAYVIQSWVSIDTVALRTAGWTALAGLVASTSPAARHIVSKARKKERPQPLRALPAVLGAASLGLVGVWAGSGLVTADAHFGHAAALVDRGEGDAALLEFEEAIAFAGNTHYRRTYGNFLGRVAPAAGESGARFIEKARDAFAFVDGLPHVNSLVDYARVLLAWSEVSPSAAEEALDLYLLAARYDPLDGVLLLEVSDVAIEQQRFDEVIRILDPVSGDVATGPLLGNLALAHARLGQEAEARSALGRALELSPTDESTLEATAVLEEGTPAS